MFPYSKYTESEYYIQNNNLLYITPSKYQNTFESLNIFEQIHELTFYFVYIYIYSIIHFLNFLVVLKSSMFIYILVFCLGEGIHILIFRIHFSNSMFQFFLQKCQMCILQVILYLSANICVVGTFFLAPERVDALCWSAPRNFIVDAALFVPRLLN